MLQTKSSVSLALLIISIVLSQNAIRVESCTDISNNCPWNLGQCTTSSFVQHRCRKSCSLCGESPAGLTCADSSNMCTRQKGQCMSSINVMYGCMKTCGLCVDTRGACEDISDSCAADSQHCPKSSMPKSVYVQFRCQKTCGFCEAGGETATEEKPEPEPDTGDGEYF